MKFLVFAVTILVLCGEIFAHSKYNYLLQAFL